MIKKFLRFTSLFLCLIVLVVVFSQNRKIDNTFNDIIPDKMNTSLISPIIDTSLNVTITLNDNVNDNTSLIDININIIDTEYDDIYYTINVDNHYLLYISGEEGY